MRNAVIVVVVFALGAALFAAWLMMRPSSASAAMLEIVQVEAPQTFDARVLAKDAGGYRRTRRTLRLQLDPQTKIVMGDRSALRSGAAVEARGRFLAGNTLRASEVVILTGYVTVR
jgi:hypothetical protein